MNIHDETFKKLHKAVQFTLAAGYQLDKEAFELLSKIAETHDLEKVVSEVIRKMEKAPPKTFFINRQLVEEFISIPQPPQQKPPTQESKLKTIPITKTEETFYPFAKEIPTEIKIIQDPTGKICTTGTLTEYLDYFRDRFKRLEKILRKRVDLRSSTTIREALRARTNTEVRIVCMITEKRESQKRIIFRIEDLESSATALVPQNATKKLQEKAQQLMLDQVVCMNVRKTRTNLLIVEDIIFPDIPPKPPQKTAQKMYAVLISDLHIGSNKFLYKPFLKFIDWLNGKWGDASLQEIASHVKYVLIAGDVVDGIGIYPNQEEELEIKNIQKQYELATELLSKIPEHVEIIIIPGNHDGVRKALPQPAISKEYLQELCETRRIHLLGNPCSINIHGVEFLLYHGRSLDDLVSTVPDITYDRPDKAMKHLIQSRHLAPLYGGKTPIAPEKRDFLVIERPPAIFHCGHVHVQASAVYRGTLLINSGTWQEQTEYMKRLGFIPTPGKVPIVNLQTLQFTTISFY
jgi:DNA polymerase II small subunit